MCRIDFLRFRYLLWYVRMLAWFFYYDLEHEQCVTHHDNKIGFPWGEGGDIKKIHDPLLDQGTRCPGEETTFLMLVIFFCLDLYWPILVPFRSKWCHLKSLWHHTQSFMWRHQSFHWLVPRILLWKKSAYAGMRFITRVRGHRRIR